MKTRKDEAPVRNITIAPALRLLPYGVLVSGLVGSFLWSLVATAAMPGLGL